MSPGNAYTSRATKAFLVLAAGAILVLAPGAASSQPAPVSSAPTVAPTGSASAAPQQEPAPQTPTAPVESTPHSPDLTPTAPSPAASTRGDGRLLSDAVIAGLVGAVSAILGVAITQYGTFKLSSKQRRGDRKIAQLDELRSRITDLDTAYSNALESAFSTSESRALDGAIRNYDRAWRMVDDQHIRALAIDYHQKLRAFSVEGDDLEVESPTTRVDVDHASHKLIDQIRAVWSTVD